MTAAKVCAGCGAPVPEGRRRYCSPKCSAKLRKTRYRRKLRGRAAPTAPAPAPAPRRRREPGDTYRVGSYEYVVMPDHPLATKAGGVAPHRLAAFDARAGDPMCDVCGFAEGWGDVRVVPGAHPDEPPYGDNATVLCRLCCGLSQLRRALLAVPDAHPSAWGGGAASSAAAELQALLIDRARASRRLRARGSAGPEAESSNVPRTPPLSGSGVRYPAVPDPTVGGFSAADLRDTTEDPR